MVVRKNPYGFDNRRKNEAPKQFKALLEAEGKGRYVARIQKLLGRISKEELDVRYTGDFQREKHTSIERRLMHDAPEVFGGVGQPNRKTLYFAIRVVLNTHRNRRTYYSGKNRKHATKAKENASLPRRDDDIIDLTIDPATFLVIEETPPPDANISGPIRRPPLSEQMADNLKYTSRPGYRRMFVTPPMSRTKDSRDNIHVLRNSTPVAGPSTALQVERNDSSSPEDGDMTQKHTTDSASTLPTRSCSRLRQQETSSFIKESSVTSISQAQKPSPLGSRNAIPQIHAFLLSCSPSMGHLLSRFVDIGFKSVAFLRVVAYEWTKEERRELLRKFPADRNGVAVTELELLALEKRFVKYRLAGN